MTAVPGVDIRGRMVAGGGMMEPWWRGIGKRHWVIIVLLALVVAAVTLLWLDAEGAGDSRLCGHDFSSIDLSR